VLGLNGLDSAQIVPDLFDVVVETQRESSRLGMLDGELAHPALQVVLVGHAADPPTGWT